MLANDSRASTEVPRAIDRFVPDPLVRECHETLVHAPASVVYDVACTLDVMGHPVVQAIIRMRERLMGAKISAPRPSRGTLAETMALGWRVLAERPGRELVMGAATQPWLADVKFEPVAPESFAACAEPDRVKIVWTLEAEPLSPSLTRFRSETRVVATDETARKKFLRYWRWARFGIIGIRLLMLPAVRREAERRAILAQMERLRRSSPHAVTPH